MADSLASGPVHFDACTAKSIDKGYRSPEIVALRAHLRTAQAQADSQVSAGERGGRSASYAVRGTKRQRTSSCKASRGDGARNDRSWPPKAVAAGSGRDVDEDEVEDEEASSSEDEVDTDEEIDADDDYIDEADDSDDSEDDYRPEKGSRKREEDDSEEEIKPKKSRRTPRRAPGTPGGPRTAAPLLVNWSGTDHFN